MAKRDAFKQRAHESEEAYFRRKEAELLEIIRDRKRRQELQREIAEHLGAEDHEVLGVLVEMGFDRETVSLLHVIPLLEVAWADGFISDKESAAILRAAESHGVREGSAASALLVEWLQKDPGKAFYERALAVIKGLLPLVPQERRAEMPQALVEACQAIAQVSGGILGFGAVSPEERSVIDRIARQVQDAHPAPAKKLLESL